MAGALRIFKALAEDHVAAAFAMHVSRSGKSRKAPAEASRGGERAGMKLGITARQPAAIAVVRRRLVGQRRESDNFGASAPPSVNKVRIDKAERCIGSECDALAGRQQGRAGCLLQGANGRCRGK